MSEIEAISACPAGISRSTAIPGEVAPPARAVTPAGAELPLEGPPTGPSYGLPASVPERLQVGTYNVAGGNEHFSENFNDRTSNELARRIQSGAVDVVALQEVAVGNENAKGRDYNVEILRDVFAHASSVDSGDVKAFYCDDKGKRHAYDLDKPSNGALESSRIELEGGGHRMSITKETFDHEGNPVNAEHHRPGDDLKLDDGRKDPHAITTYRGQLDDGREYNVVFGDTEPGKSGYGNAVVLGPGFTFRDANGDVRPGSFEVREVGQDPELWKDPGDRERRTALGVKFETPGGQTATAFSAHLSTESISAKRAEKLGQHHSKEEIATWKAELPGQLAKVQRGEMQALEQFAHAFGGDGNVVIGADMNMTEPFKALPDFYYKESFGTTTALDHIFTSRDVTVGGHHWVRPGGPNSDLYSDHAMSVVDVLL